MEGEYKPKGGWFSVFCLGFIAGVAFYPVINWLTVILIFIAGFILVIVFVWRKKKKYLISILFFIIGLLLGLARYQAALHYPMPADLDYYLGQTVDFNGEIVSEPVFKDATLEVDVKAKEFTDGRLVKGVLRLRTKPWPKLFYGDKVTVVCELQAPENTEFNYQRYLARYNIYSLCFRAKVKVINQASVNFFTYLLNFKKYVIGLIKLNVGEPEASLIGPVLFGGNEEIDDDMVDIFRRTGLTHIMAVSGFNVGILALGLAYALFALALSRKTVFLWTSLIVLLYVVIVGAPASAVRAGIMSLLLLFALLIGRPAKIINIIILTATGTLVFNPFLLAADMGWQLSFLALLGLIFYQPLLKQLLAKIFFQKFSWLVEILAATLAAQIATVPITLYNFGQVSIISPLSNILVVWLIPFFTAVTIFALPIAALVPVLGNIVFLPSFFIAHYIIAVVRFTASFSWATTSENKISLPVMIAIYFLLIFILILAKYYQTKKPSIDN